MRSTSFSVATFDVEVEMTVAELEDISGSVHWRYPPGSTARVSVAVSGLRNE